MRESEPDAFVTALQEVELFVLDPQRIGIPTRWFGGTAMFAVGIGLSTKVWVGLLIAGVFLPLLYHAHRSDPRAADVWLKYLAARVSGCNPTKPTYPKVEIAE